MKSIRHPRNAKDPLLHIEADGCLVNIRVGLTDVEGHHVTRVDISPDDASRGGDGTGHYWYQDGARIIRLEPGEEAPLLDEPVAVTPIVRGYLARAAAEAHQAGEDAETQAALDAIARLGIAPLDQPKEG